MDGVSCLALMKMDRTDIDVIVWAVKQNCLKINTDVHINVFTVIGKIKKKEQKGEIYG